MNKKRGFFTSHTKSSAFVATLIVHVVLIVVAFSFVAVKVIMKEEVGFESKEIKRPNMNLRKLQVPVDVKRQVQQPKLRKQIVAKPQVQNLTPDIQLPEIVGVKGGIGSSGGGLAGAASLGFSMPELDFFGIRGKSEKIMIILNGDQNMSADSLGGAYGYEVIKKECLHLVEELPSTAVFNILVFDGGHAKKLFTQMSAATPENVETAKGWLMPLNQVKGASTKYGMGTLGGGGHDIRDENPFGRFKEDKIYPRDWNIPVFEAFRENADTVFLLTQSWGSYLYALEDSGEIRREWDKTSDGKKWAERVQKGRKMLDEENAKRMAAGEPPSAMNRNSERAVVRAYFPGTPEPPMGERVSLGVADFIDAFEEAAKAYSRENPRAGLKRKSSDAMRLNVVYFKQDKFKDEKSEDYSDLHESQFTQLAKAFRGECRAVAGLEAIKNFVSASSLKD